MAKITAIEPQERHRGRVNVFVDGRFALGLFEEVAAVLGLRVGQEVTPDRLAEMAAAETRRRAREDAYRLLSFRSRAEREIADRLRRKGYDETVVAETVENLRTSGFLNDETFATDWVEARGRTRGNRAIAHELRQKGVDAETAARALSESRDEETERASARAAAIKKVGLRPVDRSREARARLAAFLQRRGFGWDTIRPVLNELYAGEADEDQEPTDDV
jgi:regulatory protein